MPAYVTLQEALAILSERKGRQVRSTDYPSLRALWEDLNR